MDLVRGLFLDCVKVGASAKPEVIKKIRALRAHPQAKGYLYSQWARRVGVLVETEDFVRVVGGRQRRK